MEMSDKENQIAERIKEITENYLTPGHLRQSYFPPPPRKVVKEHFFSPEEKVFYVCHANFCDEEDFEELVNDMCCELNRLGDEIRKEGYSIGVCASAWGMKKILF